MTQQSDQSGNKSDSRSTSICTAGLSAVSMGMCAPASGWLNAATMLPRSNRIQPHMAAPTATTC
jgi:hypothetical protein